MDAIIYEYENILIKRQPTFSLDNFEGIETGGYNQKVALHCIKYALEKIMNWDVETAIQRFDKYMLYSLKLNGLMRFIDFPADFEEGDTKYVLSLLYPNDVSISLKEMVIDTFQSVVNGTRKQFPRDYFLGSDGFKRFCYCLKYLIEVYYPVSSIEEIYNLFLSPKGNAILSNFKLRIPIYHYGLDIMKAIKVITQNDKDEQLIYEYKLFEKELKELM